MEQKICQSCGMPLTRPEQFGTEADGSRNEDYCIYCYKEGAFTADCTMEGMIEFCAKFVHEMNRESGMQLTAEEYKAQMQQLFPQLKRWKNDDGKRRSLDEKAAALLEGCREVTLASVDTQGYPRPVVLAKVAATGYSEVWMATGSDSVKVHDFRLNPKAGLCFSKNGNSVSLTGEVPVISDDATRRAMWQDWFINHFPQGPSDPTYTLLHFTGRRATIWIDYKFVHKDI